MHAPLAAQLTIARTWKQPKMSINRGTDKEDGAHIYMGILLSYKKEGKNVICISMDGPRDCQTECRLFQWSLCLRIIGWGLEAHRNIAVASSGVSDPCKVRCLVFWDAPHLALFSFQPRLLTSPLSSPTSFLQSWGICLPAVLPGSSGLCVSVCAVPWVCGVLPVSFVGSLLLILHLSRGPLPEHGTQVSTDTVSSLEVAFISLLAVSSTVPAGG